MKLLNITILPGGKVLIHKTGQVLTPRPLEDQLIKSKEDKWNTNPLK